LLAFQAKAHENVADGDNTDEALAEHLGEGILVQGFEWNAGWSMLEVGSFWIGV
jgi:hypothetical protein